MRRNVAENASKILRRPWLRLAGAACLCASLAFTFAKCSGNGQSDNKKSGETAGPPPEGEGSDDTVVVVPVAISLKARQYIAALSERVKPVSGPVPSAIPGPIRLSDISDTKTHLGLLGTAVAPIAVIASFLEITDSYLRVITSEPLASATKIKENVAYGLPSTDMASKLYVSFRMRGEVTETSFFDEARALQLIVATRPVANGHGLVKVTVPSAATLFIAEFETTPDAPMDLKYKLLQGRPLLTAVRLWGQPFVFARSTDLGDPAEATDPLVALPDQGVFVSVTHVAESRLVQGTYHFTDVKAQDLGQHAAELRAHTRRDSAGLLQTALYKASESPLIHECQTGGLLLKQNLPASAAAQSLPDSLCNAGVSSVTWQQVFDDLVSNSKQYAIGRAGMTPALAQATTGYTMLKDLRHPVRAYIENGQRRYLPSATVDPTFDALVPVLENATIPKLDPIAAPDDARMPEEIQSL